MYALIRIRSDADYDMLMQRVLYTYLEVGMRHNQSRMWALLYLLLSPHMQGQSMTRTGPVYLGLVAGLKFAWRPTQKV
jgi:hypothetical protein